LQRHWTESERLLSYASVVRTKGRKEDKSNDPLPLLIQVTLKQAIGRFATSDNSSATALSRPWRSVRRRYRCRQRRHGGICARPGRREFRFALPNKIFEYLAAGLPVIVADLPEVGLDILARGLGVGFEPSDPVSIAAARLGRRRCQTQGDAAQFVPDWPLLPTIYDRVAADQPKSM
jgi:hypothetical protein